MHEECTCGHHVEDDELPPGKMMFIADESNGPLVRSSIFFHDFDMGDIDEIKGPELLYRTGWHSSAKKAQREALYRYWPLYEFRHGFKHPEDPRATQDDEVPFGTSVLVEKF
jgi:hypothetical protein